MHLKKNRQEQQLFIAEGVKIIDELIHSKNFLIHSIYYTNSQIFDSYDESIKYFEISEKELQQISTLTNPNQVLAIIHIPKQDEIKLNEQDIYLALDDIQDPGNLGTIIRTAEWFGIHHIFCSNNCVEYTNPKVIMSSMGSFLRTNLYYTDLEILFKANHHIPILGASLLGNNIYESNLPNSGILLIGSESHGISHKLSLLVNTSIKIPSYGNAESLNASIANAIIISEWKRQINGRK